CASDAYGSGIDYW
nr:immunoglobulin heavy chain junction region [Macaca mulatta]MOW81418.1 immunoglobulin heavy chain junction region [Macaca mulatta]MOW85917.1 immunoglobulin heavy chain junction region [Macaca mulatta]